MTEKATVEAIMGQIVSLYWQAVSPAAARTKIESAISAIIEERDQAVKELTEEHSAHLETIKCRDYFEGAIQGFHLTLGGDGEWSSDCDLVPECADMIEALQEERDAAMADLNSMKMSFEELGELHADACKDRNAAIAALDKHCACEIADDGQIVAQCGAHKAITDDRDRLAAQNAALRDALKLVGPEILAAIDRRIEPTSP